tara:strand:+ start:137 stop:493 length:357 start_codon:yes stop_codon:yes gene_type:complete
MVAPATYVDLKVPALRDMCAARGLDNTGLRRALIARLERKDRLAEERDRGMRLREKGLGHRGREGEYQDIVFPESQDRGLTAFAILAREAALESTAHERGRDIGFRERKPTAFELLAQ